jgi:exopolysaccharide production protein ExoZ
MIGNLQILRAFAASGVVLLHTNATVFGVHTEFNGVALFFILSGYLMCRVRNRSATAFAADRIWRIVPNYWLATALLLTLLNMWEHWPAEHVALSALFIPHESPGGLYPVLGVGWTLNLEMYFYAVFTLAIWASRRFAPVIAAAVIGSVFFVLPWLTDNEAAKFYFAHKYVWCFLIGIGVWYLSEWLNSLRLPPGVPRWTIPLAFVSYAVLTVCLGAGDHSPAELFRWTVVTISAFFCFVVIASSHGADLQPKLILLLGEASYACYLLHTILIEVLRHHGIATSGTLGFAAAVLVGAWVLAILWHLSVERLVTMLRRRSFTMPVRGTKPVTR